MVCWIEGGAGFSLFSFLPGGAVELPGRSRPAPGVVAIRWGPCGVLSLRHFRLARWCSLSHGGWSPKTGAAQFDLLGPPGWCSGCWPHDGDVAGGAGFLFSDIPVRSRRWSSGDRSDRRCGRCGATGSPAPTALIESRVNWSRDDHPCTIHARVRRRDDHDPHAPHPLLYQRHRPVTASMANGRHGSFQG
jgi:hypothetical protein